MTNVAEIIDPKNKLIDADSLGRVALWLQVKPETDMASEELTTRLNDSEEIIYQYFECYSDADSLGEARHDFLNHVSHEVDGKLAERRMKFSKEIKEAVTFERAAVIAKFCDILASEKINRVDLRLLMGSSSEYELVFGENLANY